VHNYIDDRRAVKRQRQLIKVN